MKKTMKRIIALVLALAMSLSLLSANVWAAEVLPQEAETSTEEVGSLVDTSLSAQSTEKNSSAPVEKEVEEQTGDESASVPELTEEIKAEPEKEPEEAEESAQDREEADYNGEEEGQEGPAGDEEADAGGFKKSGDLTTQEIVASGSCGAQGDNLTWMLDSDGTLTISGTGAMCDYSVQNEAPWNIYKYGNSNTNILEIVIEPGITHIGDLSFSRCPHPESISLPESVESIGSSAFSQCTSLKNIIFSENTTSIGDYAFDRCYALKSINLSNHLVSIGKGAFSSCTSIQELVLPQTIEKIGDSAFYECSSLDTVYFPDKYISIGAWAFNGIAISELTIPSNLSPVGVGIFSSCNNLKTVNISNGVTRISDIMFANCEALESIYLPESVRYISGDAFRGCDNFVEFEVSPNSNYLSVNNGILFDKSGKELICYPYGLIEPELELPSGITFIPSYAFQYCPIITSLVIPDGVDTIGQYAFESCDNLTDITFPGTLRYIPDGAFNYCKAIKHINLSNGLISIQNFAFRYCSNLESISIPKSVKSIGYDAFGYCDKLKDIYFEGSLSEWYAIDRNQQHHGDGYHPATVHCMDGDINATGYAYMTEEWATYCKDLNSAVQFLCDRRNFLHVKYINDEDESAFGQFKYCFNNFIKLSDGWKELLKGETSKEDAKKIIYASMYEKREAIDALSKAKAGKKAASMLMSSLTYYLDAHAVTAYDKNELCYYMSSDDFIETLTEGGYTPAMGFIQRSIPEWGQPEFKALLEDYETSTALKTGLDKLGKGLKYFSKIDSTIDYYHQVCQIQESNEIYCEILDYIAKNAKASVVREAAQELLSVQQKSVEEAMEAYALETAGDALDSKLKSATEKLIKKIPFIEPSIYEATKFGFEAGEYLSNKLFHTSDEQAKCRVMRVSAYVGEAVAGYVMQQAEESMDSVNDLSQAEKAISGLEVLAKVRLQGEEALRGCCSYKWNQDDANLVAHSIEVIKAEQEYYSRLLPMRLESVRVSGAAKVEVYDANQRLIATIQDGEETEGKAGDVHYETFYNSQTKEYTKVISVPENSGYTYKVKGNGKSKVSCQLAKLDSEGNVKTVYRNSIPVSNETTINITPKANLTESTYQVVQGETATEEKPLIGQSEEEVAVTAITADITNINLTAGENDTLYYTITPENASNQNVTWSTSDETVASVTQGGVVTGVSEGTATITATSEDGEHQVEYNVSVTGYSIEFEGNGARGTMQSIPVALGESYALPECAFIPKEYLEFAGWQVGSNPELRKVGDIITPTSGVTVTAVWKALPTLAAYTTDGTASIGDITAPAGPYHTGDTVTVTAPAVEGYSFLGWYEVTSTENGLVTGYGDKNLCTSLQYSFELAGDTSIVAVYKARGNATVTIQSINGAKYTVGNSATVQSGSTETAKLGTTLTVTARDGEQVLQWLNESDKVIGKGEVLSIPATGNMTIKLVYKSDTEQQSFVQFVSDYDQVLSYKQYSAADIVAFPDAPTKYGYEFNSWVFEGTTDAATAESIKERIGTEALITLKPSYTKKEVQYTVTVNYEGVTREADTYPNLEVGSGYSVYAPKVEGYTFQYWKRGDTIVGYKPEYFLQVDGNINLTAVYGTDAAEAKPVITLDAPYAVTAGEVHKVACSATRSIPEGYTLVEHGILYARDVDGLTEETFVEGTTGVGKYISTGKQSNGVVKLNVKVATDEVVVSFRGYMTLKNNETGNTETFYSGIQAANYSSLMIND